MTDSSRDEGTWEEGPTTLDAAADYAHHIRERLNALPVTDDGRADLDEAVRLLDVLEGYLQLLQRQSE